MELGEGVRSTAGRVTTGSSALRPAAGALGPLVLSDLRGRPLVRSAVAALLVAAVAAAVRRRR